MMYPNFNRNALVVLMGSLLMHQDVSADQIIDTLTGETNQSFIIGTFGYDFAVGPNDIQVNRLGYYDYGQDGLLSPHEVGIWKLDGTLLSSATVPSGVSTLIGEYQYVDLSAPLLLAANTTFRIGAMTDGGGFDEDTLFGSVTPGSGVFPLTAGSSPSRVHVGPTLTFPSSGHSLVAVPNADYSIVTVPEPASFALLMFLSTAMLSLFRKR